MANPFYVPPVNAFEALMAGRQGYNEADQRAKEAEREAIYKNVAQQVQSGGLTNTALGQLFGAGPQAASLIQGAAALEKARQEGKRVHGTPLAGYGPNGEFLYGSFDAQGNPRLIPPPAGMQSWAVPSTPITTPQAVYQVPKALNQGTPSGPTSIPNQRIPPGVSQPNAQVIPGNLSDSTISYPTPQGPVTIPPGPIQAPPGAGRVFTKDIAGTTRTKETVEAEVKKEQEYGAARARQLSTQENLDNLIRVATEVKNHKGLPGIFGLQGVFPNIPGGEAANAKAKYDSLVGQVGFGALRSMREESKSGGALGQVTEAEHTLLQNQMDALGRAQNVQQAQTAIGNIIAISNRAKARAQAAFNQDYGRLTPPGGAAPQTPQAAPQGGVVDWQTYFGKQ
jgi:hypothetical protein